MIDDWEGTFWSAAEDAEAGRPHASLWCCMGDEAEEDGLRLWSIADNSVKRNRQG
jgi:hypothetical protein